VKTEAPPCPPSPALSAKAKEPGKTDYATQLMETFNATYAEDVDTASAKTDPETLPNH